MNAGPANSPEETARTFYGQVLARQDTALPTVAQRNILSGLLSARLNHLLRSAAEMEGRCLRAAKEDEKPHILEGALLLGNYEGATEVLLGPAKKSGATVRFDATLMYVDPRFPKAHPHRTHVWKDSLVLRHIATQWVIDEVMLGQKTALTAVLNRYLAEGERACTAP